MSRHYRIRTVYRKELKDILRDRRTLIAMIVVPIVLYPLLMLGSIQAVSAQSESLGREPLVIGTISERQQAHLEWLVRVDADMLDADQKEADSAADEEDLPHPLLESKLAVLRDEDALVAAVRERSIHVGVVFGDDSADDVDRADRGDASSISVRILVDMEEVRSRNAYYRLQGMFERLAHAKVEQRLRRRGLPPSFVKPFALKSVDLSSPPSILGQVLPLILVLMTITGAIYPAIDLTAGERERGTLESLMVCPVPVFDLIVGKFLVVTTVAIMGAALNLTSVTLTVYFGGFEKVLASTEGGVPIATMGLILASLVPFAVFMSAIMIAVCSYARTFKEAQNYVTPVILAVLIPGGIAALPTTQLEGIMVVMPVGNMVLLARDLLLGAQVAWGQIGLVVLSTSLYAVAAVAIASGIFGRESVVFADAASLGSTFSRRLIKPTARPTITMSLLMVSLLFPTWFFVQAALSPSDPDEGAQGVLTGTAILMPCLFVILPALVALYFKVDLAGTFSLRMPSARAMLAALAIGISAWVPAHELNVILSMLIGMPEIMAAQAEALAETLRALPVAEALMMTALIPAICEELLFRGFLLSGLREKAGKWTGVLVCGAAFGIFHFILFKFPVTFALGVVLAYLCWQTRSIVPCIFAHLLHNSLGTLSAVRPALLEPLFGGAAEESWAHLPPITLVGGLACFAAGLWIASRHAEAPEDEAETAYTAQVV